MNASQTKALPSKIVVGIIGGIASGKTLAAKLICSMFEADEVVVVEADKIAHQFLNDPSIKGQIEDHFGDCILTKDGSVDRRRLAEIVFGEDAEPRGKLEAILHPAIRLEAEKIIASFRASPIAKLCLVDAPLLIEVGWDRMCDRILLIDTPEELRQSFAAFRNWTKEELVRREKLQSPLGTKRHVATNVIINDGDLEKLKLNLRELPWIIQTIRSRHA